MSKKRPTESTWDSDEELLNDTSGNAITAFPKTSELDLLGDDGELDEDALLGVDETGAKTTTISFANDSLWSMTARQRAKNTISHQEHTSHDEQDSLVNEQAFVFEETDTADLEDELNVGGQEDDGSGYHDGSGDYTRNLYHQGVSGSASNKMQARNDRRVDYSASGMNASDGGAMGYMSHADQAAYGDDSGAEFGAAAASGDYIGDAGHETHEDVSGVELEYEQPVEHEDQVHLEYEDSRTVDHDGNLQHDPKNSYESESDSDDEGSRHSRGKFTSERTGVISLTPANTREAIPDTLEINDEQAAQIEQFMSDKTQKVKGRGRSRSRPSAHSRLGSRPGSGSQQIPKGHPINPKGHQQNPKGHHGSRMAPFPRGMLNQNLQLGFPFPGGPQNRGPFPVGLLNPRGHFPLRLLNQRGLFSGPQNQRQPFPLGPGGQRGQFPMNMLLGSGLQRGPFPQERFAGGPNQRGPFTGGPQSLGPQRMSRQNLGNSPQGPQNSRGLPPNQLRPQGSFNQRGAHTQQFGPRPPNMGQMGNRPLGPRNAGPRPLMGQNEAGMRFVRANRPTGNQQDQSIPSLVKPGTNLGKSPQGGQQLRPGQMNPLMPQDSRRISPHQRLGPVQGQHRLQNPTGPPQRPKFMPRGPVSGGPVMNPPMLPGSQQPPMGGQGDMNAVRKHKIYINPRFQGQQEPAADTGLGRTVKMGVPIQQKKAKVLLEKAIQNQNKPTPSVPETPALKRKSAGGETVPAKVMKSEVPPTPEAASTRVVQASSEPSAEEAKKINALLEEQRKQREMIQKKKELARQKQAAIKRKELEIRLKEEGKTINDILGTAKTDVAVEQKQAEVPVKQISGSVAARLGPPPPTQQQQGDPQQQTQHSGPTPAKMRPPLHHGASGPVNSQQFSGAPHQSQNIQARTPAQTSSFPNQPKGPGPSPIDRIRGQSANSDTRYTRPSPNNNPRLRGPPPANDPRFQTPPPSNQFRTSQSEYDKRYMATQSSQENNFTSPPPNTDHRIRPPPPIPDHRTRAPPPILDSRLRTASHQSSIQSNPAANQSIKYTEPPPAIPQSVRFQAPHSAPPQVLASTSQQFQTSYTPASAPPTLPPSHYPQPSQSDTSVYTAAPQYTPQTTSYQQAVYTLPAEHQYQPHTHYPPPSQPYAQPTTSQYQLPPHQQYQPSEASMYQMPPVQPQYQPPPAQPHYQTPPVQSQYHVPPVQTQYQAPPPQPQYQAPLPQSQYQPMSTQQYQSSAQSYSAPSDQHYQQINVGYYTEPQPIQTVTSQVASTSSTVGDQRTVQHHTPVGQRIQTIGQRVQPASVAHMRSIIHNVVSQPSHVAEAAPPARHVQSQPVASRVGADGQVAVLDGPQKILIQNVPPVATKETLIKICRHFGQVLGVNLMSEQNKAVVQFQKGEQAAKCVAKCNQKCLHKTRLTVKLLPS